MTPYLIAISLIVASVGWSQEPLPRVLSDQEITAKLDSLLDQLVLEIHADTSRMDPFEPRTTLEQYLTLQLLDQAFTLELWRENSYDLQLDLIQQRHELEAVIDSLVGVIENSDVAQTE